MTELYPRLTDHPDKTIRLIEVYFLKRHIYNGSISDLCKHHPTIERGYAYWLEHYGAKAKQPQRDFMGEVNRGVYTSLDEFYEGIKRLMKPVPRGKALKDKKKRVSQKEYQKEKLGEAFVDNDALFREAKKAARDLAFTDCDDEAIKMKAAVLAELYAWDKRLSDEQLATVVDFLKAQIEKHQRLDRIEAKILEQKDKNLYYMYGQIKRQAAVGDTLELGITSAAELCACSRSAVKPILGKLEKLGFINCIQKGRQGSMTGRSSIYRREV